MRVKFWGTRGSIATPSPECIRYGGDTSCVEVRTPKNNVLILDAGTGIRRLGMALQRDSSWKGKGAILLSHAHWDHIQGFPFFKPAFNPKNKFVFYGQFRVDHRLEDVLRGQMEHLYFPVRLNDMAGKLDYVELIEQTVAIEDVSVTTRHLNHPQGCFGYRIEDGESVLVYATDTEHEEGKLPEKLIELAQDADLLIYDTMYTEKDYQAHRGWGHSTWNVGIEIAKAAGVKTFCFFHHNPEYTDDIMDRLVAEARAEFSSTIGATRDLEVELKGRRKGRTTRKARSSKLLESDQYDIGEQDGALVVVPAASLESFKSEEFKKAVLSRVRAGLRELLIDLRMISEMDSLSLGVLATFVERARDFSVPVAVANASDLVREILRITRFDQVVRFRDGPSGGGEQAR